MIKNSLEKITNGINLDFDESCQIMNLIMSGKVNNSQIAGLLLSLRTKGETAEEVAGFAKAMRDNSIKVKNVNDAIDVCGTGGDNSGTFNISTAAAFVVAGAGIKMAKHGNRSISSKSGSADVLIDLGLDVNLSPEQSAEAINKIGVSFLFAPNYHPAMKYVMPVRKDLSMKTVFNILGPLTNPANTKRQVIGTYNYETADLMAEASKHLEMEKVCFVCTENKFDEVLLNGKTKIVEVSGMESKEYFVDNSTFGFPEISINDIKGDDAKTNAKIICDVFENNVKSPAYYVVAANAALGLYVAGLDKDLRRCTKIAEESILTGKALSKIIELKNFGIN